MSEKTPMEKYNWKLNKKAKDLLIGKIDREFEKMQQDLEKALENRHKRIIEYIKKKL